MSQRIVIDPVTRIEGHAKITIHLDDAGEVRGRPLPRHRVPRVREVLRGAQLPRDAGHHRAHLRHLPGLAPARLGQGHRRPAGGRHPRDRPHAARRSSTWPSWSSRTPSPSSTSPSPDLLLGYDADPARRNVLGLAEVPAGAWPARGSGCASGGRRSSRPSPASGSTRPGRSPAAWPARSPPRGASEILAGLPEALGHRPADPGLVRSATLDGAPGGGPGLRQLPLALHGAGRTRTASSTTPTASSASWTRPGQIVADQIDPADYETWIGEAVEPRQLPQVALLQAARLPRRHLPGRPAGPAQRLQPRRHAAGRRGAGRVPAARARRGALLVPLPLRPADRDPLRHRADRAAPGRAGDPLRGRLRGGHAQPDAAAWGPARRRAAPSSTTTRSARAASSTRVNLSSPPARTTWP